ncbi:MAG: DoxX family protein [Caldilineaceae bacterium]
MLNSVKKYGAYGTTFARIAVGALFLLHGLSKFGVIGGGSMDETVSMFGAMNMPVPAFTAVLVAVLEAVGGLALILGYGARVAAAILGVIMLVAILAVKLPAEANPMMGYEIELALLAGLVMLFFQGAGAFSLEEFLQTPKQEDSMEEFVDYISRQRGNPA